MTRARGPEATFTRRVVRLARARGWYVAHFPVAQTNQGWRTPVQGDGAGFPDLVLVRDRILFAELKSDVGRLSDHQREWRFALTEAGATYYLWRPKDWPDIHAILSREDTRDALGTG